MGDTILNSSSTGGILTPSLPYPIDDDTLDQLIESVTAQITTLTSTLVRPRWQPTPPIQPSKTTNWCAFGILMATPDDGPVLHYDAPSDSGKYQRHETLSVLFSFYGPNAKQYAALLRDGLAIPQNIEAFTANNMAFISCDTIRQAPELVNQEWIKRQDMMVTLRRQINRTYPIHNLLIAKVRLVDDTNHIDRTFKVPDVGQVLETDSQQLLQSSGDHPVILATEP